MSYYFTKQDKITIVTRTNRRSVITSATKNTGDSEPKLPKKRKWRSPGPLKKHACEKLEKLHFVKSDEFRGAFLTCEPLKVFAMDVTTLPVKLDNAPSKDLKLLVIMDIGTGKVVFSAVEVLMDWSVLHFGLKEVLKLVLSSTERIIFHSDRGSLFTSVQVETFVARTPKICWSMTSAHTPTRNAKVERHFNLVKNQAKEIWQEVLEEPQVTKMPPTFKSLTHAQTIMNRWYNIYNTKFKQLAKQNQTPVALERILLNANRPENSYNSIAGTLLSISVCPMSSAIPGFNGQPRFRL